MGLILPSTAWSAWCRGREPINGQCCIFSTQLPPYHTCIHQACMEHHITLTIAFITQQNEETNLSQKMAIDTEGNPAKNLVPSRIKEATRKYLYNSLSTSHVSLFMCRACFVGLFGHVVTCHMSGVCKFIP